MLTIGIGQNLGSVQHSRIDGDSAYLMAVNPDFVGEQKDGREEYFEFLCGDTPTPIAKRYILPFETVKQICGYFLENGDRDPSIYWEEF